MASRSVRSHLSQLLSSDLREYFRDSGSSHPGLVADEPSGDVDPLRPGSTAQEVAATLLLTNFVKKFEDESDGQAPNRCLLAFLESNYGCSQWTEPPKIKPPLTAVLDERNCYRLRPNPAYQGYLDAARRTGFEAIQTCLRDTFERPVPFSLLEIPGFDGSNPWSLENIFLLGDIGPGASLKATGTSWLDKFYLSPITYANPQLREAYETSLQNGTLRRDAENQRRGQHGYLQVVGGVFGSVPKSYETERSIETQPALEMWAQKGIATIMAHYVRAKYGVDLATQPEINKELARRGSVSDSNVTIDLTEASNRISYRFIQQCLAGTDVLGRISEARVVATLMPWGEYIDLHMCSTMGNGYTFILETAVFLAVVEAAYLAHGENLARMPRLNFSSMPDRVNDWVKHSTSSSSKEDEAPPDLTEVELPSWGVFGDDIIVPKSVSATTEFYLGIVGAEVNRRKSFFSGLFRESCGGDFFNGVNVRAVYCRSIKSPQDKVSLINRLCRWTATWGIPLRRVCRYLWAGVNEKLVVPLHESDDAGLKCSSKFAPKYPRTKAVLQVSQDLQVTCTPYKYFRARPYRVTYSGAQLVIYGPGLLLSMLKGETVSSRFSTTDPIDPRRMLPYELNLLTRDKQDRQRYDTRWGLSYDWDRLLGSSIEVAALDWAVSVNLPKGFA